MTQEIISTYPSYDSVFLKESFKSFISQTDEFKNYDFDGSGLKEIIRILSYSDMNGAIQNQFMFSELNMDSADIYNNVVSLGTRQGYLPRSKTCAKIVKDITVIPKGVNPPTEIILKKDVRFITRTTNNKVLSFSPSMEYRASLDTNGEYVFTNVELWQGIWNSNAYVVQTANSIESYRIPEYNADTNTLIIAVKDNDRSTNYTLFNQFKTAHDLGSDSNIYYCTCKRDGFYYAEFGDDILSKKLAYQNIVYMSYLVTDGDIGNNLNELTAATPIAGYTDITLVGSDASFGGGERESKESIRINACKNVSTKGNCVSDSDYESAIVSLYPNVLSVRAWGGEKSDPLKYGYTYISAKFKDFDFMSTILKADMVTKIKERNVGSITPIIVDPDYVYIDLDVSLRVIKDSTLLTEDTLKLKVSDALKVYSSEQLELFDSNYDTSNIVTFVKDIDKKAIFGCRVSNKFKKSIPVLTNYSGSYTLDFLQPIKQGTVYIDGFTITDILSSNSTYIIKDNGVGILQLFRVDNNTSTTTLIINNIGAVDYTTGLLNIVNFNPNILTDGANIFVTVTPIDNSVFIESTNNIIFKLNDINISVVEVKLNA